MKIVYLKRPTHPLWAKFSENKKQRYFSDEQGIHAKFDRQSVLPHYNHIEMSGFGCSVIVSYRIDKNLHVKKYAFTVFPSIRMYPDVTRSSLSTVAKGLKFSLGKTVAQSVDFNGTLTLTGSADGVTVKETITAAADKKAVIFQYLLQNNGEQTKKIAVKVPREKTVAKCFSAQGKSTRLYAVAYADGKSVENGQSFEIKAGESERLFYMFGADKLSEGEIKQQFEKRREFLKESAHRLCINTPDKDIDDMVRFCKIRASESIFDTPVGLMHSPGGGNFYGALWTNDECEYVNPLFAYLGYDKAREQSLNCYELFGRLAKEDEAIYTSIIACGKNYWHGAGDRGDNAMYLYGLSRYLLTTGDRQNAVRFMPYIEKALGYQISRFSDDDILLSDSDELENRFLSGNANLSTQCIAYDAFVSLSYLFAELGKTELRDTVIKAAERVRRGIKNYFEANVEGYDTYRYCKEETRLRSWICLPLTVGIEDAKQGTVDALMSDKLLKDGGMLTRSGEKTYWDRSVLYAIKGLFIVQESEKAYALLKAYTEARLKGEHAPYPREAFPEGNAAHLSAESGLYLRILTEGVIGYRPTGFSSFDLSSSLPEKWNSIRVKNIYLCGKFTDILVERSEKGYDVTVDGRSYSVEKGQVLSVNL